MVHYLPLKMITHMVLTLQVKKTTLIILDMLKSACPNWQGGFFILVQIMFFYQSSWFENLRNLVVWTLVFFHPKISYV
jgi:hypothetical protein